MDYKYIEQLLDRYFLAETTLEEEQILKSFFAQRKEDMPQELSQYAPLFTVLDEKETLGSDFDERMLQLVEGNSRPAQQKELTLQVKARTISLTERLRPLFGAAATIAILLTLGNAINQSFKQDEVWVDTDKYAAVKEVAADKPAVAYDQLADSVARVSPMEPDSLRTGQLN
jgi:hypothetical protein